MTPGPVPREFERSTVELDDHELDRLLGLGFHEIESVEWLPARRVTRIHLRCTRNDDAHGTGWGVPVPRGADAPLVPLGTVQNQEP